MVLGGRFPPAAGAALGNPVGRGRGGAGGQDAPPLDERGRETAHREIAATAAGGAARAGEAAPARIEPAVSTEAMNRSGVLNMSGLLITRFEVDGLAPIDVAGA